MLRILLVLAILFSAIAAQAAPPATLIPATNKAACVFDPGTGFIVCPPAPTCIPPLLWHTDRCECGDGSTPTWTPAGPVCSKACTVTITYSQGNPSNAAIGALEDGCDVAGAELAIAVGLAKSMGMKTP